MKKSILRILSMMLMIIMLAGNFVNSYAADYDPLNPLVVDGAGFYRSMLSAMGFFVLTPESRQKYKEETFDAMDKSMWKYGYYWDSVDKKYKYGVSVPKKDLDYLYNHVLDDLGGYGVSEIKTVSEISQIVNSNYYIKEDFPIEVQNVLNSMSGIHRVVVKYGSSDYYCMTSSVGIGINGNNLTSSKCYYYEVYKSGSVWKTSKLVENTSMNTTLSTGVKYVVYTNTALITAIPPTVWNPRYISSNGVNYSGWRSQPDGNVLCYLPEEGEEISPDKARISDQLNESGRLQEINEDSPGFIASLLYDIFNFLKNLLSDVITLSLDGILDNPIDTVTERIGLDAFQQSYTAFENMQTGYGEPPKIYINLHQLVNTAQNVGSFSNGFADQDSLVIDFAKLEEIQFMGMSLIQLIRSMLSLTMISITVFYIHRKLEPSTII